MNDPEAPLPCPNCGNAEPARVSAAGCERCRDFARCFLCHRFVDDDGFPPSRQVSWPDGSVASICDLCYEKAA